MPLTICILYFLLPPSNPHERLRKYVIKLKAYLSAKNVMQMNSMGMLNLPELLYDRWLQPYRWYTRPGLAS
jgi:hypothetical protein